MVYIGSADMMHRNLDRRVEALVRLRDPGQITEIEDMLTLAVDPGTASWHLEPEGIWTRHARVEDGDRAAGPAGPPDRQPPAATRTPSTVSGTPNPLLQDPAGSEVVPAAGVICWRPDRAHRDTDRAHRDTDRAHRDS